MLVIKCLHPGKNDVLLSLLYYYLLLIINNGTRTEWSAVQGEPEFQNQKFEIKNTISPELYDTKAYYQLIITITKFEKNITVV